MVERTDSSKADYAKFKQIMGTPMAKMTTPITFEQRKNMNLKSNEAAMRKLVIVSFVSVFFITAQLIGGYMAGSIAIFTDSAHLASDMLGFAISMMALNMGQQGST